MEELRSTEILDKEIQGDARKKVENLLKKTEAEVQKITNSVDSSIAAARKEKEEFYNKNLAAFVKDQDASVPLEKARFEISFVQKALQDNIDKYLASLSEEKRIELVLAGLDSINLENRKVNACVYGFDIKKIQKILEEKIGKNLIKCEPTVFNKIIVEEEICQLKEGVILQTEDLSFRCRLTLSEVISNLLDKYRAELSDALFGAGGY